MRGRLPLLALVTMAFAAWFHLAHGQLLLAAVMLACTAVSTWLYTKLPHPQRSAMHDDDDDEEYTEIRELPEVVADQLEKSRALLAEVGPFRVGTPTQVFCAMCQTWCMAEASINDTSIYPAYGILVAENQAIHLHCNITLHVHNHECVPARTIVAQLHRAHEEGQL
jgi:hypothetical protein